MNDYATGAIPDPTRARVRIQIRTEPGQRDEILFAKSYSLSSFEDERFVLSYLDRNNVMNTRVLFRGQYFETKLMG